MPEVTASTDRPRYIPTIEKDSPIADLMELQSIRRHCIKAQGQANRSIEALMARVLGYHAGLEEKERKAAFKLVASIRKKIEDQIRNQEPAYDDQIPASIVELINTSYTARHGFDLERTRRERDMIEICKRLPIAAWIETIRGFSYLGASVLIAEIGDIGQYRKPSLLWKRLGLACMQDGYRQGMIPPDLSREEKKKAWIARGYAPQRRAEVFVFVDDVLLRSQWIGDRDAEGENPAKSGKPVAVAAHALGPYGALYAERKAWNLARGLTTGHADKEARRFMSKRLILDMWIAWHTAIGSPFVRTDMKAA